MSRRVRWLEGATLTSVEAPDPNPWFFRFGTGITLTVETPWRIIAAGRIALGDCDHNQRFGLPRPVDASAVAMELAGDRSVATATIADETADLAIEFEGGSRLEVYNSSSGYEGWQLLGPNGALIISLGGGQVSDTSADA